MTQKQRKAVRSEVIGPCTIAENKEIRQWLIQSGEPLEGEGWWRLGGMFELIRFEKDYEEWCAFRVAAGSKEYAPTITFADFKQKYMKP